MATKAKKLPSGSWRARVSYTAPDGKRRYESFTAPTKKEAEYMALEFENTRAAASDTNSWTVGKAIDEYIKLKELALSPSTIQGYRKIRRCNFQGIMNIPLKKLTQRDVDRAVRAEL